jgi:hypothetical protein
MEVIFIKAPEFKVNFKQFLPKKTEQEEIGLIEKCTFIAQEIIRFVGIIFISTIKGAFLTLKYTYSSFSRLILDTLRITDFYFGAFKIAYWVFTQGFTFVSATGRFIFEAYASPNELYLSQFLKGGIYPSHIQTKEVKLDVSDVPKEIKVDDLLTHFAAIDFTNQNSPFYMTLRSGLTKEQLEQRLKQLVERVNNRTAFLGTPPAYDNARLEAFYQQMENAIRLSLHKLETKLTAFLKKNPDASQSDDPAIKKEYQNHLENRSRMVIDLAIAGNRCGARYMGEVMEAYFHICGEGEISGTLQETIFQVLAEKRLKIARAQIQMYYGTDTHAFSKYMQNMGSILAIPGTESIIEHISQSFNIEEAMGRFFAAYDEACIIETIQEKLRQSQPFRELVIDWLKDQRDVWIPPLEKSDEALVHEMQEIIDKQLAISPEQDSILKVIGTVFSIDSNVQDYPSKDQPWDEFVDDLFALNQAKKIFLQEFPNLNVIDRLRKKNEFLSFLKYGISGKICREKFEKEKTPPVLSQEELIALQKIEQMRQVLPIDQDILGRVLKQETDVGDVVRGYRTLEHDTQFLLALNIGNLKEQGLCPLFMEWLLNVHEVFYPQSFVQPSGIVRLDEKGKATFRGAVDPVGYAYQIVNADETTFQAVLPTFESEFESRSSRYLFGIENDRERILNQIFEKAFKEKSEDVIAASYVAGGKRGYSKLRNVVMIDITSFGAKMIGHLLFKTALSAYIIYKLVQYGRIAYEKISIGADKARHYLKEEAHRYLREGYKTAAQAHFWIQSNKWKVFIYGYLLRFVLNTIPYSSSKWLANQIDPSAVLGSGGSYLSIMIGLVWDSVSLGWNASSRISNFLEGVSNRERQERLAVEKQQAFAVWKSLIASP